MREKRNIEVSTRITDMDGECEEQRYIQEGSYAFHEGRHLLVYEEAGHEASEKVLVSLVIREDEIILKKSGVVQTKMIFDRRNFRSYALYQTAMGSFELEIETEEIKIIPREDMQELFCAELSYMLYTGGEPISKNQIRFRVR